jgi:HSP20 family molecular chaperone IbpA
MTGFLFSRGYGFPELFGKVQNLKFNSIVKDLYPSVWESTETGYKCTAKTLGIRPEDLTVKLEDDYIVVSGESEVENQKYNTYFELPVCDDILNQLKEIKYKSENGLTFIYLEVDKPEKKKIEIKKI